MTDAPAGRTRLLDWFLHPVSVYRGYWVAVVAFLSTGLTVGMTGYAFGAFIEPLEREFGWTRSQVNVAVSLMAISGLASPLMGRALDRVGSRPVMVGSLALVATGFLLRSLISELWQLYVLSAVVAVGSSGATVLTAGRLVSLWFPKTRGRMMGIVTAGNNFGGLTMVPFASAVIAVAGWRWGFAGFGLLMALMAVVAFVVIRDRPRESGGAARAAGAPPGLGGFSVRAALKRPTFYLLTAGISSGTFTYAVVLSQLIPHLENEGFSSGAAAAALSVMAGFGLASKLIFGRASEGLTARYSFIVSLCIQAVGLLLFIVAGGSPFAWLAVVVFGLGFGGMGALIPLTVAEAFGMRAFGSIMGLVNMIGIVPQLVGPPVAGLLFGVTGSYALPFAIIIGFFMAGALSFWAAKPPARQAA
ncbi:MAG: MFS transporter [Chloroflexi bacterium]|nr:MFS transporter [Chloroflexota bacterium]